jgi:hypothetical protein
MLGASLDLNFSDHSVRYDSVAVKLGRLNVTVPLNLLHKPQALTRASTKLSCVMKNIVSTCHQLTHAEQAR